MRILRNNESAKRTYVAIVLDRSGSMSSMAQEALNMFNEQVRDHKRNAQSGEGGDVFLSLVLFDNRYEEKCFAAPIDRIQGDLTMQEYAICGGTALYDAVGKTIDKLSDRYDRDTWDKDVAFLVVVISDGDENSSHEFRYDRLQSLIKEKEATGRWTFQFLGSDMKAVRKMADIGMQSAGFAASAVGMNSVSSGLLAGNSNYYKARGLGQTKVQSYVDPSTLES